MKILYRNECSVLSLVLTGKWFDMIALGQKKEEYREYSEYWKTRIWNWKDRATSAGEPMVVEFRRGYAARPQRAAFLLDSLHIRGCYYFPHPDWGEPCREHYALGLGERVVLTDR